MTPGSSTPPATIPAKAQIREHLQGIANEGLSFDLSQFKNDNGRVTYAYKVLINGELVEEGDGGLTIVKNGKIVFDGTYEPPLGPLGRAIDRVALRRVADSTVKDWVDRIALALETESVS